MKAVKIKKLLFRFFLLVAVLVIGGYFSVFQLVIQKAEEVRHKNQAEINRGKQELKRDIQAVKDDVSSSISKRGYVEISTDKFSADQLTSSEITSNQVTTGKFTASSGVNIQGGLETDGPIQSSTQAATTDPGTISMYHDGSNGHIDTNKGSIFLTPANGYLRADGNLYPKANNTYNLGVSGWMWKDIYLQGGIRDSGNPTSLVTVAEMRNARNHIYTNGSSHSWLGQSLRIENSPTFRGLTLNGNLSLGTNTLTTSNATVVANLNADTLDGYHAADLLGGGGGLPAGGTVADYLRGDGTWQTLNASAVDGLGSLATLDTINNGNWSGIALTVANGGTGGTTAAEARTNLGLGSLSVLSSVNNDNWSGTDLSVANGGTGASDVATARTNLGVVIGTNVQAYNSGLSDIAGLAVTDGNIIVGNGANWAAESGATARTSLGLGNVENTALSTWAGTSNITTVGNLTSGTINGATLSGGSISGGDIQGGTLTALAVNGVTTADIVLNTGSYANPSWITSLAKSKVGLTNVEDTALSTWAGTSNITTVGNLTSGTINSQTISSSANFTGTVTVATSVSTPSITTAGTDIAFNSKNLTGVGDIASGDIVITSGNIDINQGSGVVATANMTGDNVTTVTVTNGGSGFKTPPNVYFRGGGVSIGLYDWSTGRHASAYATINASGVVTAITIVDGGVGYVSAPEVIVTGGNGLEITENPDAALHVGHADSDFYLTAERTPGNLIARFIEQNITDIAPNTHNTGFGVNVVGGRAEELNGVKSTGGYNTGFGSDALMQVTSGYYNTAVGTCALDEVQGGHSNTAMGMGALVADDNASMNSGFGMNALIGTSGNLNTAVGYRAGLANTTGAYNLYLGADAGMTSTATLQKAAAIGYNAQVTASNSMVLGGTGVDAVKVGIGITAPTESLDVVGSINISSTGVYKVAGHTILKNSGTNEYVGSSDYSNTLVGDDAGMNITPLTGWQGVGNVAIGKNALKGVTTGTSNVAIGLVSLQNANTTASNNVAIGMTAGDALIGNQNVFLGDNSGGAITGSGNVMIGYQAGKQASQTAVSNKLYIDNSSTATPLLYGDFSADTLRVNGKLGVGVAPTAVLHLKAGTAAASTAPIKLTSGTLMTVPEIGAVEYDGSKAYITLGDAVRREIMVGHSGTTASIGGGALAAGACASADTTVTGAATTMTVTTAPNTYPGDGYVWQSYVSAADTVTTKVCAIVAGTPTSSTYNIRVIK